MIKMTFDNPGTFEAIDAARSWCYAHSVSVASMCGDDPMGLLWGKDICIAKWRNLTEGEKKRLHGRLTSRDFRNGPVTLELVEEGKGLYPHA